MNRRRSVTFINPFSEGHHLYYATLLATGLIERGFGVYAVGCADFVEGMKRSCAISGSEVVACSRAAQVTELEKRRFLKEALKAARGFKADYIHLQQLDRFIFTLFFLEPFSDLSGVLGTLHWAAILDEFAPNRVKMLKNSVERRALKRLTGNGLKVMAHSRKFTSVLNGISSSGSAGYVPYPVSFPVLSPEDWARKRKDLRERLGLPSGAKVMLSFGGTRFEKGADIAVNSLKRLPESVYLIIAGIAEHFTKDDLRELGERLGVSNRLKLCMEYIPESMVADYFAASDIVVAPYRKTFAGQCGPITIAASYGVPVVGSDSMIIKETVERYSLGRTFPSEDTAAFARAVMELLAEPAFSSKKEEFNREHSADFFCLSVIESYEKTRTRT